MCIFGDSLTDHLYRKVQSRKAATPATTNTQCRRRGRKMKRMWQSGQKCVKELHDAFHQAEGVVRRCPAEYEEYSHHKQDGGGQWKFYEQVECPIHHTFHNVEVVYVRNPRDVDLLIWYLDGEKLGYTME